MEQRAKCRRSLLLHIRQDVGVDLERHRHLRVAEPFTDDMNGLARLEQKRGTAMTKSMELDRPDVRLLDQVRVLALAQIVRL